jgi:hypothetical protein
LSIAHDEAIVKQLLDYGLSVGGRSAPGWSRG